MKNLKIIFAMSFLLFLILAFNKKDYNQEVETITLEKAIKDKIISATFVANGSYSGNSLQCEMKNLQGKAIKIQVPAGTYFQAPSDTEQDLMVPKEAIFALNAKQSKSAILNGFCTNLSNSAPKSGGNFKLVKSKTPEQMPKLLAFLKGKKYENHTLQDAIWCLTNKSSVSDVYGDDEKAVADLRKELFVITGQKETWYTSPQQTSINEEDRSINRETAAISGELKYETKKGAKVHTEVFSPEGEVKIKTTDKVMELGGSLTFNFKVEVKGWKKGTYKVKVIEDSKVIKSYDFVV